ncbi:putative r3h and g-patch domain-containing protein [Erysiphe neolycopersici]|uniref:Putative r3h and g-patch domain-containing protein n=1 Tax=Erysiphe neolycopersici TaxID=212602 RepID=A0A420HYG4_9PEZI|nr:putative r3h and g-patch domain-containing protein [Erysiphe neolycopersici]
MVHSKTTYQRGNLKSKPYGRGGSHKSILPFANLTKSGSSDYLESTLRDEAFNTSNNKKQWYSHKNLRNTKVAFVSAGKLENDSFKSVPKSSDEPNYEAGIESNQRVSRSHQISPTKINTASQENQIPVIKCVENHNCKYNEEPTDIRLSNQYCPNSPTPSSSSEEIILFQGRKPPIKLPVISVPDKKDNLTEKKSEAFEAEVEKLEVSIKGQQPQLSNHIKEILSPKPIKKICTKLLETSPDPTIVKLNSNNDATADYLSNLNPQDNKALVLFSKRDLGGTLNFEDEEFESPRNAVADDNFFLDVYNSRKKYNHTAIYTSDNLRTELDVQHPCKERKKTRVNSIRSSSSASSKYSTNDSIKLEILDSDDSESCEKSDYNDPNIEVHISKHKNFKRNANTKRTLIEYDELEISSENEISKSEFQATYLSSKKFQSSSSKKKKERKKLKKKGLSKAKNNKPDIDSNYDELDIFDIMDFDRPSPPKRNTAIKFSDPTTEEYMKIAIRNNRFKKQEKKKEREILRNLGLLGNKSGKQDLRIKYKSGMDFNQLKGEIKKFLMDGSSTLILPPMKKADRQVVHEIANMLKLKSQSNGVGAGRFPILYRTSRTTRYADDVFHSVEVEFSHGFFPRKNKKGKGFLKINGSQNSGAKRGAVSYQDGEIVGGSAPEIAADNKGRTMLEKMGWSSGTALGAINNKGILQPLPHVVKKTKKGLA